MRVVLPAGLSVAFVAIVVAGLFDEGRVAAPSPEPVGDTVAGPSIGDHWHATYEYIVCGDQQPHAPAFSGVGIHTHGGEIIHLQDGDQIGIVFGPERGVVQRALTDPPARLY